MLYRRPVCGYVYSKICHSSRVDMYINIYYNNVFGTKRVVVTMFSYIIYLYPVSGLRFFAPQRVPVHNIRINTHTLTIYRPATIQKPSSRTLVDFQLDHTAPMFARRRRDIRTQTKKKKRFNRYGLLFCLHGLNDRAHIILK